MVGTLPPLNHHCHHSDDHHSCTEPCCTVDYGTLHGLQEMVLTGIAAVAQRTHTCCLCIGLHTASVAAAASLAALLALQAAELTAYIQGGGQALDFREGREKGGRRGGAVGLDGSKDLGT